MQDEKCSKLNNEIAVTENKTVNSGQLNMDNITAAYQVYIVHQKYPHQDVGLGMFAKFGNDEANRNNFKFCHACHSDVSSLNFPINIELQSNKKLYCAMCVCKFLNDHSEKLEPYLLKDYASNTD